IVPTGPGTIQLPPIKMSAFDPQQKKYVTLSASVPSLKVTGEAKPVAAPPSASKDQAKEAVATIAEDIVPLRREVRLWSQAFGTKDAVYASAAAFFALLSVGGLRFNQRWRERRDERRRASAKARAAREAARGVTALRK